MGYTGKIRGTQLYIYIHNTNHVNWIWAYEHSRTTPQNAMVSAGENDRQLKEADNDRPKSQLVITVMRQPIPARHRHAGRWWDLGRPIRVSEHQP